MWRYGKSFWQLGMVWWAYLIQKQNTVSHHPYRLWIEPTNRCNLRCTMCPNKDFEDEKIGMMDFDLFKSIIDQVQGEVHDINLHHRGEPTLHPKLPDMIKYAHKRGVRTKLHTNGTTLTSKLSRALIDSGLELISFSFDGYMPDVYESVRVGASFNRTLKNIQRFLDLRAKTVNKRPRTVMEIMDFSEGVDPVIKNAFLQDLKKRGMDRIIQKKPHNWAGNVDLDTKDSSDFSACTFPWHAMVVLWDGRVGACPHDFFAEIVYGDANKTPISEIFNNHNIRQLRAEMLSGELRNYKNPCANCDSIRRKRKAGIPFQSLKYIRE